jgi:hypothetical protein
MATTGAPWNLFYPLGTDLVKDGAGDIQQLAEDVAAGLTVANTGIGSNVVQTVKTNQFTTTSGTYVDITGMSATITPSSASAKVLVIVHANISITPSGSQGGHITLLRGSTEIYRGDASGNQVRASGYVFDAAANAANSIVFLDSPGVATATTYKIQGRRGSGGTLHLNTAAGNTNTSNYAALPSSVTLIEVAA